MQLLLWHEKASTRYSWRLKCIPGTIFRVESVQPENVDLSECCVLFALVFRTSAIFR